MRSDVPKKGVKIQVREFQGPRITKIDGFHLRNLFVEVQGFCFFLSFAEVDVVGHIVSFGVYIF